MAQFSMEFSLSLITTTLHLSLSFALLLHSTPTIFTSATATSNHLFFKRPFFFFPPLPSYRTLFTCLCCDMRQTTRRVQATSLFGSSVAVVAGLPKFFCISAFVLRLHPPFSIFISSKIFRTFYLSHILKVLIIYNIIHS